MKKVFEGNLLSAIPRWRAYARRLTFFSLLTTFFILGSALLLAVTISEVVVEQSQPAELLTLFVFYLALMISRSFLEQRQSAFAARESQAISSDLREELIRIFINQDPGQLFARKDFDLLSLVTERTERIRTYFGSFLPKLFALISLLLLSIPIVGYLLFDRGLVELTLVFLSLILIELAWSARFVITGLSHAAESLERIQEIVQLSPVDAESTIESEEREELPPLGRIKEVRWTDCEVEEAERKSVTFRWGIASSGKLTVIRGEGHQAKTKLVETLIGIYQPIQGRIFVETSKGTVRVTELEPSYWSDQIGWISREPHFLPGSIEENFRLIKPRANRQKMSEILEEVGLGPEILPESHTTLTLSIDRSNHPDLIRSLALARVLLKDPLIVIVEMGISKPESEEREQVFINKLKGLAREGKIVILVSDDEYAKSLADRVIAFERDDAEPQILLESAS